MSDGQGSLNFNPGVDVGLGLSGALYQDSSPTITFHEHARGGQRHKTSIAVSLSMVPQAHIAKETHFKIKDKPRDDDEQQAVINAPIVINSAPVTSQPVVSQPVTTPDDDNNNKDCNKSSLNDSDAEMSPDHDEPQEFHYVTWYSSTLNMMPQALARQCQSTLFVFPKDHEQKKFCSAIEFYVDDVSDDGDHLHNGYDLLNGAALYNSRNSSPFRRS